MFNLTACISENRLGQTVQTGQQSLGHLELLSDYVRWPTPNWIPAAEPVSCIRYKLACAYSEDSYQSEHLHSLIRVLVFCLKKRWILGYPLMTDQTVWMHSLIGVFDGCTCQPQRCQRTFSCVPAQLIIGNCCNINFEKYAKIYINTIFFFKKIIIINLHNFIKYAVYILNFISAPSLLFHLPTTLSIYTDVKHKWAINISLNNNLWYTVHYLYSTRNFNMDLDITWSRCGTQI